MGRRGHGGGVTGEPGRDCSRRPNAQSRCGGTGPDATGQAPRGPPASRIHSTEDVCGNAGRYRPPVTAPSRGRPVPTTQGDERGERRQVPLVPSAIHIFCHIYGGRQARRDGPGRFRNKHLITIGDFRRASSGLVRHLDRLAETRRRRPDQLAAPSVHLLTMVGRTSRYGPMKKASPVPSPK